MHLCVILGDLDSAVRLALYEEEWQLELLARVGDRLVDVGICLVEERVRHLDVPFLQLRDGDLLLDEL